MVDVYRNTIFAGGMVVNLFSIYIVLILFTSTAMAIFLLLWERGHNIKWGAGYGHESRGHSKLLNRFDSMKSDSA